MTSVADLVVTHIDTYWDPEITPKPKIAKVIAMPLEKQVGESILVELISQRWEPLNDQYANEVCRLAVRIYTNKTDDRLTNFTNEVDRIFANYIVSGYDINNITNTDDVSERQRNSFVQVKALDLRRISVYGGTPVTSSPPEPPGWGVPASYVIFEVGAMIYAKNGATGLIDYSGADASTVIQSAEDAIEAAGGGNLFFKKATYDISSSEVLIQASHIHWIAEAGAVIESDRLPALGIVGAGEIDSDLCLQDISVEHLTFRFKGSVTAGNFIYVYGVQSDYKYQGAITFRNVNITSTQVTVPSNYNFVGLYMDQWVGVRMEQCNIKYFGTDLELYNSASQADMFSGEQLQLTYAYYGLWFNGSAGTINKVEITQLKVMFITGVGINCAPNGFPMTLTLIQPQFESMSGATYCINTYAYVFSIINGMFSSFNTGIIFAYGQIVAIRLVAIGNNFFNGTTGIWTFGPTLLIGNSYSNVTTPLAVDGTYGSARSIQDGYITENSGTSTGTGAQQTISHGLSVTPNRVYLTQNDTGITQLNEDAAADATNIYPICTTGKKYTWRAEKV